MSLKDGLGRNILTLEGLWSILLKLALASFPVLLTGFLGFVTWVVITIYALQNNQTLLTSKVESLNQRITDMVNKK